MLLGRWGAHGVRTGHRPVSIPLQGFVLLGPPLVEWLDGDEETRFNPSAGIRASWTNSGASLNGRRNSVFQSLCRDSCFLDKDQGWDGSPKRKTRFNPSAGIRASWTSGMSYRSGPGSSTFQSLCRDTCFLDSPYCQIRAAARLYVSIPLQGFVLLGRTTRMKLQMGQRTTFQSLCRDSCFLDPTPTCPPPPTQPPRFNPSAGIRASWTRDIGSCFVL